MALGSLADSEESMVTPKVRVVVGLILKEDLVVGVFHEDTHVYYHDSLDFLYYTL